MAEYWKSTPSYWCKFCSIYVRDTVIERKNHEASFKHQNNIQRGLRDIHKNKERETRDQQRAKDEVARLNGLVTGNGDAVDTPGRVLGAQERRGKPAAATSSTATMNPAAQRKLHAEQLIALGVELPEDLKREVQGIASWEVLSERVVEPEQSIGNDGIKLENGTTNISKGVRKRNAQSNDDDGEEEAPVEERNQRKAWGSKLKTYPGKASNGISNDIDALLGAVSKPDTVKKEETGENVKNEAHPETSTTLLDVPDVHESMDAPIKEESEVIAPPIAFKKRKIKR